MGTEVLVIPEENVMEAVHIIERGLEAVKAEEESQETGLTTMFVAISQETKEQLKRWCLGMKVKRTVSDHPEAQEE